MVIYSWKKYIKNIYVKYLPDLDISGQGVERMPMLRRHAE